MDIATLIGLIFGLGIILAAIITGGDIGVFVNAPGLMIVVGGTMAATLIKFKLKDVLTSFAMGIRTAFKDVGSDPKEIFDQSIEMGAAMRKTGPMALEAFTINNDLFRDGVRLIVDGHKIEDIRNIVHSEINQTMILQEKGEAMFRGIGESAPAFGMLGTLVGLVQMLANLDDPASIGPAMAVAMLTTFYGALIANLIALPIADKLARKTTDDQNVQDLIVESINMIFLRQNRQVMAETLAAHMPAGLINTDDDSSEGGDGASGSEAQSGEG